MEAKNICGPRSIFGQTHEVIGDLAKSKWKVGQILNIQGSPDSQPEADVKNVDNGNNFFQSVLKKLKIFQTLRKGQNALSGLNRKIKGIINSISKYIKAKVVEHNWEESHHQTLCQQIEKQRIRPIILLWTTLD
ncbi:unnamed protein product [Paramecium octaurelia]|uniref:Uncharacterized protein n=1 Tax=Paramecium octaurelia TaxID=43137 RepID=A0A8S1X1D3_PAROT|nr:unnamed protein product [Paramecium octaurelia]